LKKYDTEYVNQIFMRFTNKEDPDRAFMKIMLNLDKFVEEASKYVADNGFVYMYVMADKESYNNRHKKNGVIKNPFVVINQKEKVKANYEVKRKLERLKRNNNNENETDY